MGLRSWIRSLLPGGSDDGPAESPEESENDPGRLDPDNVRTDRRSSTADTVEKLQAIQEQTGEGDDGDDAEDDEN